MRESEKLEEGEIGLHLSDVLQVSLFWFSRFILLFFSNPWLSDVPRYFYYSKLFIVDGKLPYRDFSFEYSPVAFVFFLIPALIHRLFAFKTMAAYRFLFSIFLLGFDWLLFRKFCSIKRVSSLGLVYLILTLASFPVLFDRFDLLMGFFLVWPFLGMRFGPENRIAFSWGFGAAIKLISIPSLFFWLWNIGMRRRKRFV